MNVVAAEVFVSRRERTARLFEAGWSHQRIADVMGLSLKTVQNEIARCRKSRRLPPCARHVRLRVDGLDHEVFRAAARVRGESVHQFLARLVAAAAECPDAIRDDGVLTPKRKRA